MQKRYIRIAITVFIVGLIGMLGIMQGRVVRAEEAAREAQINAEERVQQVLADTSRTLAQQKKMQQEYEQRLAVQNGRIVRLLAAQQQRTGTR